MEPKDALALVAKELKKVGIKVKIDEKSPTHAVVKDCQLLKFQAFWNASRDLFDNSRIIVRLEGRKPYHYQSYRKFKQKKDGTFNYKGIAEAINSIKPDLMEAAKELATEKRITEKNTATFEFAATAAKEIGCEGRYGRLTPLNVEPSRVKPGKAHFRLDCLLNEEHGHMLIELLKAFHSEGAFKKLEDS